MTDIIIGVDSWAEWKQFVLDNAQDIDVVSFDLETDSVEEVKAVVWGVGLAFQEDEAFYLPLRTPEGTPILDEADVVAFVTDFISKKRIIAHNGVYDCSVWKHRYGIDLSPSLHADTILMKHALNEEPPFGLKEVSVMELGEWADLAQKELYESITRNGGTTTKTNLQMFKADTAVLGKYCCWDVMLTFKLYNKFNARLEAEGLTKFFYEEEVMPLYREVTIPMKYRGVKIDSPMFTALKDDASIDIGKLTEKILTQLKPLISDYETKVLNEEFPVKMTGNFPKAYARFVGFNITSTARKVIESLEADPLAPHYKDQLNFLDWMRGAAELSGPIQDVQREMFFTKYPEDTSVFNINSKHQLKWLFFDKLKAEPLSKTEKGEPQVDDAFLTTMEAKHKWVIDLRELNTIQKINGTYIEGIMERAHDDTLYTSFLQFGTTSGRYASRNPNCLSMDTQILTKEGFKSYSEITAETEVAAYTGADIRWEKPSRIIYQQESDNLMVSVKNQHFDMRLTSDHRVIFKDRKKGTLSETTAIKFPKDAHILHGAVYSEGDVTIDPTFLQFLVATQADAELTKSVIRFKFYKKRKADRLRSILITLGYEFVERRSSTNQFEFSVKNKSELVLSILGKDKTFPESWVDFNKTSRDIFINELFHWNGSFTRKQNYSSNNERNADIVQALVCLSGFRAHKRTYVARSGNLNYQVDITYRDYSGTANRKVTITESTEPVWCVTVSTGMIMVRRGSDTFVTGNCQNWPAPQKTGNVSDKYVNAIRYGLVARPGYKLIGSDFSSLEPHISAYVSEDPDLIDIFVKGKDFYSAIAIKQFGLKHLSAFKEDKNYLGDADKKTRNKVKTYSLAAFYGASAYRIAEVLDCPVEEADHLLTGYLDSFPGVRKLIETSHHEAVTQGFVKTIYGRVRHLAEAKHLYNQYGYDLLNARWARARGLSEERSKFKNLLNNSVNFKIQGTAGHIMNKAMILTHKLFKEHGIDGHIVLVIHDEELVEVREDQVEKAAALIKQAMETCVDLGAIKLKATPVIGNSYGECK